MIDLSSYERFMRCPSVRELAKRYELDAKTAKRAVEVLIDHLEQLNFSYAGQHSRTLFTTCEGRVKLSESFFKKLYNRCRKKNEVEGLDNHNLESSYAEIHDLAGVRFACPYFDEVESSIREHIRPFLKSQRYRVDLSSVGLKDQNYLDDGDASGYRSYHFFLKVPTPIDIYENTKFVICEVQGRSELEHVWATKSHELLYKKGKGWNEAQSATVKDMKALSHNLRSVDHFLCKIRKQVRGV